MHSPTARNGSQRAPIIRLPKRRCRTAPRTRPQHQPPVAKPLPCWLRTGHAFNCYKMEVFLSHSSHMN